MKKALLVIDVQEAITKHEHHHINQTLNFINQTIQSFESDCVYYVQHIELGSEFDPSSPDSILSNKLNIVSNNLIEKNHHSAFYQTTLHQTLTKKGINSLYIVGFQTEYCVDATIKTAHFLGYNVFVYTNGHHTFDHILGAVDIKAHYNEQFKQYATMLD
jgi:nicotinamidase-related amidase